MVTLITCSATVVFLPCTLTGIILAVMAIQSTGESQQINAGISLGLNITVVFCCVITFVILVITFTTTVA